MRIAYVGKTDCVEWTGGRRADGYGFVGGELAHRVAWREAGRPLPVVGYTIDHLCRNRGCVNVDHMEVVTRGENVLRGESPPAQNARKTHCVQGHPYEGDNLYINPRTGWRQCRECNRRHQSEKKYYRIYRERAALQRREGVGP